MRSDVEEAPESPRIVEADLANVPVEVVSRVLTSRRVSFDFLSSYFPGESGPCELLRVSSPWIVLQTPSGTQGLIASRVGAEQDGWHWAVAVLVEKEQADISVTWDDLPVISRGEISEDGAGWRGPDWRLTPHPLTTDPARSWVWPWLPGSYSVQLIIHIDATAQDIHGWLTEQEPSPYRRVGGDYKAGRDDRPEAVISVDEGRLVISRSFESHPPHLAAFDAGLCRRIDQLSPALLSWDVLDSEYIHFVAGGDGAPSLADLIDPAVSQESLRGDYAHRCRTLRVDATDAADMAALVASVARALGLRDCASPESLEAAIRCAQRPELPAHVDVTVSLALADAVDRSALTAAWSRACSRVVWSCGVPFQGPSRGEE